MARMRSIKPEFFADQDLAEDLPGRDGRDARLLYIALWGQADEHARLRGDARWIKGQVYPFDDDLTPEIIDRLIDMIAGSGRAIRYRVGKATYLFLPRLAEHQRLEPDKTPSRLPDIADEQAELIKIIHSENFPDKSEPSAEELALARARLFKHVAGSREHVAESMEETLPLAALAESASEEPTTKQSTLNKRAGADAFNRFWSVYPRKVSRGAAEKAFASAAKTTDPDLIVAGAVAYRDHGPRVRAEIKFTKHPATWLNGQCWLDDLPADAGSAHQNLDGDQAAPGNVIALRGTPTAGMATADRRHLQHQELIAQLRAQEGAS